MSVVGAALRGFGKALKIWKTKTTGTDVAVLLNQLLVNPN